MVIKRRLPEPEVKLPSARLYLEDVEEIIGILRPDADDQPPVLAFTVDDEECDSIEDLRKMGERKIGGQTDNFEMNIQWKKGYHRDQLEIKPRWRANLSVTGSIKRQSWVTNQVSGVFARRIYWLGRLRWLVITGAFIGFAVTFYLWTRLPVLRGSVVRTVVPLCFGPVVAISMANLYVRSLQSAVILKSYQPQESWLRRYRDQIVVAAVTALVTNPIAVLIAILLQRWFGK